MQFSILQENLIKTLNVVKRAVPSKPQLPILSSFLISVSKTKISVSATNLYLGIESQASGSITTPGEMAVPAKIFYEVINHISPGKIELSLEKNTLIIKSKSGSTRVQCLTAKDFPSFPSSTKKDLRLQIPDFTGTLEKVLFSASRDETRPILTSVLFSLGQKSRVVTTNGFRLAVQEVDGEFETQELLAPAKSINEVVGISKQTDSDAVLSVSTELKQLFFFVDSHEITVRMLEGDFPPYQKIIPSSFKTEVEIDVLEFVSHLKAAQIFARDVSNIVSLEFGKNKLVISAVSSSLGSHQSQMDVSATGQLPAKIAFNVNYILDFIQAIKPEKLWFGMNEGLQPAMFKISGDDKFFYVVMPFKLNK